MTEQSSEIQKADESLPETTGNIEDPGLPVHEPRLTDTDPKAAKRSERAVATMFGIAALSSLVFVVGYVLLPVGDGDLEQVGTSNLVLGLSLGLGLFLIGAGAIHWARKLMPDIERVQERHSLASTAEDTKGATEQFAVGTEESGFTRRTVIRNSLLGAMALLPLPALFLLGDLGPLSPSPAKVKADTIWRRGTRVLNDQTFTPIKVADVKLGQVVNAMPETYVEIPEEEHGERLIARSTSAILLVRMNPDDFVQPAGQENWAVDGIIAYSKICTHVGCPISLYEQTTKTMICPCHQSTFDLADGGKVVFGPAKRALPQLPLGIDSEGYLVAQSDFPEPVGPSYWEREQV
jgi:ubiquinol-cytochrome c reductase iron-sulfur subunit